MNQAFIVIDKKYIVYFRVEIKSYSKSGVFISQVMNVWTILITKRQTMLISGETADTSCLSWISIVCKHNNSIAFGAERVN